MKSKSASKIKMTSYDELLGSVSVENDVKELKISQLTAFHNHPFQVRDDEEMEELVESICLQGILTALVVRPTENGLYEIISGHRRCHAAKKAGIERVPVVIKEYDDDDAIRAMVDSNLQREHILPSEKAFAYRMKLEALTHQGIKGDGTAEEAGKENKDSRRQVYRYIRLTYLTSELLQSVDNNLISLLAAVELSYLREEEQQWVQEAYDELKRYPNVEQAKILRAESGGKLLTPYNVKVLMVKEKRQPQSVSIKREEIKKYFPEGYEDTEIIKVICSLLEKWSNEK